VQGLLGGGERDISATHGGCRAQHRRGHGKSHGEDPRMKTNRDTVMAAQRNPKEERQIIVRQREETNDAPVFPVEEMERLHRFRPDLVDWIVKETTQEIQHRQAVEKEGYDRILHERRLGQYLGFAIGFLGMVIGGVVAVMGAERAGIVIASVAVGTLAIGFLKKK
jgi:hypothetical protein